jgi:hypothetical protein
MRAKPTGLTGPDAQKKRSSQARIYALLIAAGPFVLKGAADQKAHIDSDAGPMALSAS